MSIERLTEQLVAGMRNNIQTHALGDDESGVSYRPLKDGSHTISFCDTVVFRMRKLRTSLRIEVKTEFSSPFGLDGLLKPMKDESWSEIGYGDSVCETMTNNAHRVYERCTSTERFGCCSRYLECSDELRCVQPNVPWAHGCMYRENLNRGRVFYGKNRNFD